MKILIICDTHGELYLADELENIEADFALCLGDLSMADYHYISHKFQDNCAYILGNHEPIHMINAIDMTYVHDRFFTLDDISFYAFGGSFKYKDTDSYLLHTTKESFEILDKADAADILLTHDGRSAYKENQNLAHQGLLGITNYMAKNKPQYHIFGHYHENRDSIDEYTNEMCIYQYALLDITKVDGKLNIERILTRKVDK